MTPISSRHQRSHPPIIGPMADDEHRQYKIGEVCKLAEVQPYVLRYWETEFPPLAPTKSGGGQRMYTRREIDIILRIKQLLYSEMFSIQSSTFLFLLIMIKFVFSSSQFL